MEHKEAEELFKKQINSLDNLPPEVNWQKERSWYVLEEKLKPVNKKKWIAYKYYSIAASIVLIVSISWFTFDYISRQEKQITHLQKKLENVKEPKNEQILPISPHTLAGSSVKKTSIEPKITRSALKKTKKNQNAPVKKPEVSDFITDSVIAVEPILSVESDTQKIVVPAGTDQVSDTRSVQEIVLSKVKKKPYSEKARQIIIVFPNDQDEYLARQPAELIPKAERKAKLSNIIINNLREDATKEAQQNTGTDTYLRINPERIK